jgi:hypothetical protein
MAGCWRNHQPGRVNSVARLGTRTLRHTRTRHPARTTTRSHTPVSVADEKGNTDVIIDRLARQTHRRGFLAAVAALAAPTTARGQHLRCSPYGGGCTLSIHCCGHITCYREPLNPNSGVCGIPYTRTIPEYDPPAVSSTSVNREDGPTETRSPSRRSIIEEYDRNRDHVINCRDFACWEDAQAFLRRYPDDPFNLDGNADGEACEHLPRCRS